MMMKTIEFEFKNQIVLNRFIQDVIKISGNVLRRKPPRHLKTICPDLPWLKFTSFRPVVDPNEEQTKVKW
jgi:chloramphenicol O-acetyltransferase